MRKVTAVLVMFFLISGIASASSINGDFEGNPIVTVQSNKQELTIEDVPAINYNGRTMLPIYLLKQLGAKVEWNADTYSVNVDLGNTVSQQDAKVQERMLVKDAYQWLKDTDNAIWIFTAKLPQYANLEYDYSADLDTDYEKLLILHNESLTYAKTISEKVKIDNKIMDIISNEIKTLEQIRQTRDMLKATMRNNTAELNAVLKISMFNSFKAAQENIANTNEIFHSLLLQNSGMTTPPKQ
jgi:hypothetical protein